MSKWLKKYKGSHEEVSSIPPSSRYYTLLNQTLRELNRCYKEGAIQRTRETHPVTWNKIDELEDQVNDLMHRGLEGEDTLKEFQQTLEKWKQLIKKICCNARDD